MGNDYLYYFNSESDNSTSINTDGMCDHYTTKYYCPVCGREIEASTSTCPTCGSTIVDKATYQSDHVRVVSKISCLIPDSNNSGNCTCSKCGLQFVSGLSYDSTGVAVPSEVKYRNAYKDINGDLRLGTMPIIEPITKKLELDDSYTVPLGYHDGTDKLYTGTLSEYTVADAAAGDIRLNKTAWVNGTKIVGTLDVEEETQEGTATADDIVEGKTAWVNHSKLTGTIVKIPREDQTLMAGESYTFPAGLSAGTTVIAAASLASQTQATATEAQISIGSTAWVNGIKLTGTFNFQEEFEKKLETTDALASHVISGEKFYSNKYKEIVNGLMTSHIGEDERVLTNSQVFYIPEGYYDGLSKISVVSLASVTYADAVPLNILEGKTAWVSGVKLEGTMPLITPTTIELSDGGTYIIPQGYHNGNGKVIAKGKETPGTAREEDILLGKTAWVAGTKLTGTMPDNAAQEVIIAAGETYHVPQGFHTDFDYVTAKTLASQTVGDAVLTDIVDGKIAWVNGEKVIGSMVSYGAIEVNLKPGQRFYVPAGHHSGSGYVEVDELSVFTQGTATASDIANGKTAWVNGVQVFGSFEFVGDSRVENVLAGKTFYSDDDSLKTGTMPNIGMVTATLDAGTTYEIPKGYHDGSGKITAKKLEEQTEGTATAADILEGKTAWVNGVLITGTMQNVNEEKF